MLDPNLVVIFSFIILITSLSIGGWLIGERIKAARSAPSGVGADELRRMIRDAVAEASEPLHDRLDAIQDSLSAGSRPALPPAQERIAFQDEAEEPERAMAPSKSRERMR